MITLIVTTTIFLAAILLAGIRLARRMPEARAWDPNSHDKITFQAINMLADGQDGKLTLMGWVLRETRTPIAPLDSLRLTFFKTAAESQIRRGSVEEDMNSSLLTHKIYDVSGIDSLEAPNGAYHFFNGITQSGLTDSSVLTRLFGKTFSGCTSPLPSAHQRATAPAGSGLDPGRRDTSTPVVTGIGAMSAQGFELGTSESPYLCPTGEWHLDDEGRNYSFTDSERYFKDSYTHLAFYSIGRIAHLLDDMALPGHVRDDSHAGTLLENIGCDPSDPVEVIADKLDKPEGANGDYDRDGIHKWAFNPKREYPGTPNETAWSAFTQLKQSDAGSGKVDDLALFAELARDTHDRYYSFNTIPGNIDSHEPEASTKTPYIRTQAVEWDKCDVNFDALWSVLAQFCIDLFGFSEPGLYKNRLGHKRPDSQKASEFTHWIDGLKKRTSPHAKTIGIGNLMESLPFDKVLAILKELPGWCSDARHVAGTAMSDVVPPTGDYGRRGWRDWHEGCKRAAHAFIQRYEAMNIPLLIQCLESAGGDLRKGLQDWINKHPSEKYLRESFHVQSTGWHSLGPCCLTESIVLATIEDRQAKAAGNCAYLFSKWFESLYNAPSSGRKPGMALWLNKQPPTEPEPPKIDPIAVLPNDSAVAKDAALLAIANHLPMPLNYTIEITLIVEPDETDEDLCKSGVQLDLQWGHLFPKLPAIARAGTCAAQELNDYLADLGGGGGKTPPWAPKTLETITLGGIGADGNERPRSKNFQLDDVAPYNLESLVRVVLAPGKWAPAGVSGLAGYTNRDMGGILRKDEAATLIPVPAWPDQTTNRDKMTASILRITPSEAPVTPVKSDAPPPPSP